MTQLARQLPAPAQRKGEQQPRDASGRGMQGGGFRKRHRLGLVVTNDENVPQGTDRPWDSLADS